MLPDYNNEMNGFDGVTVGVAPHVCSTAPYSALCTVRGTAGSVCTHVLCLGIHLVELSDRLNRRDCSEIVYLN